MNPQAYPLAWPAGKPRTAAHRRKHGTFRSNGSPLTNAVAADRVEVELDRLGAIYPVISSNVEVTLSGRPRSGQKAPEDPGVCVYFQLAGKPYAMACDGYTKVADNLAAIAAHIDATRAIARYGVASAAETLQAFQALPSPKKAHEILGVSPLASEAEVRAAWRKAIAAAHPDQGGSEAAAAALNAARDELLRAPDNSHPTPQ